MRARKSTAVLEHDGARELVLQTVYEIGETFTASLRLQPVLDRIIRLAMDLAGGDTGSVMLLTPDGTELVVAAAVGPRAEVILGQRQPAYASVAGRALQLGEVLQLRGQLADGGAVRSAHPQDLPRSLVVPLRVEGRLVGVLNLNTLLPASDLPAETLNLLRLLASQATLVIENARLYDDLARKERRLELFVDRFLNLQAEQQRARSEQPDEARLRTVLAEVLRETMQEPEMELRREPQWAADSSCGKLTERERQVLTLIVEGLINKEIARRLGLSPNTVKNHVASITEKLGVADRTQAAVLAIRQGLLT